MSYVKSLTDYTPQLIVLGMSSITQKVASLAIGDMVARGLGFISSMVLARVLGPESYGIWTTALAIFSYMLWFSDLGMMQLGTREMAKKADEQVFSAAELFFGKCLWALLAFIILFIISPFLPYSEDINALIWLLLFSLIPYALHTEWLFSGKQDFLSLQGIKALQATVFFGFIVYGIQQADDLEKLPVYYGISVGITSLLLWVISVHKRHLVFSNHTVTKISITSLVSLIKESLQLGVGWVSSQVILLFPPLIFALVYSESFVGWYGAALRIIMLYMVLDRIFVQLLLPNLSKGWNSNTATMSKRIQQAYRYHTLLGLFGSFGILFLAPFVIPLIYGDLYTESIPILQILSPLLFLTFQNSVFATSLIATQQSKYYLKANLLGGVICTIFIGIGTYFLIDYPSYALFFIVLSEGIMMYLAYYFFNKYSLLKSSFPFYPMYLSLAVGLLSYLWFMGNPVLMSTLTFLPNIHLAGLSNWLMLSLTLLMALIPLLVTKTIKRSDWRNIRELMKHRPQP